MTTFESPSDASAETIDHLNVLDAPESAVLSAMDKHLARLDAYRQQHGAEWCPASASEKRFRKFRDPLEARRFLWNAMRLAGLNSREPLTFRA